MANTDKLVEAGVFDLRYATDEQKAVIDQFSNEEVETLIGLKKKYFAPDNPLIITPCFF